MTSPDRRGTRNPNALLTPLLVREVRLLHRAGFGYLWIARWLGVSKSCVRRVIKRQTWAGRS